MLKMKPLRESLLDDDLIDKTDKIIKDEIKAFLKANYRGSIKISRGSNQNGKYEVSSTKDIIVKNRNITSLTNGMFIWTTVDGSFDCMNCNSLESLEGAPKEVGGQFYCFSCLSLTSLKYAPEKVGGDFYCSFNKSLKSLEDSPKEVGGSFYCSRCPDLTSLEGAPKEVGGDFNCSFNKSLKSLDGAPKIVDRDFDCSDCPSLKSLEGAPKEVGGDFNCMRCSGQFTKKDVKKISNVKKNIIC